MTFMIDLPLPSLQLLVALAVFDSTYLAGTILESFRKSFGLATVTHLRLFPQVRSSSSTLPAEGPMIPYVCYIVGGE